MVFEVGYTKGCELKYPFKYSFLRVFFVAPIIGTYTFFFISLLSITFVEILKFSGGDFTKALFFFLSAPIASVILTFIACIFFVPHLAMFFIGVPAIFILQKFNLHKWYHYLIAGVLCCFPLIILLFLYGNIFFVIESIINPFLLVIIPPIVTALSTWYFINIRNLKKSLND